MEDKLRQIGISWQPLNIHVTVNLDEERNSNLADLLWESLPYRSLQGHALVAGRHLYHAAPIHGLLSANSPYRVDRRTMEDGTITCSRLQRVSIKYGELSEPMLSSPIGHVVEEDRDVLTGAGLAIWEAVYNTKQPIIVEVRRAGQPGGHHITRLHARSEVVDSLIEDIYEQTESDWLTPSVPLTDLYTGHIQSGAGSFDTVLTTLLFVSGDVRSLGHSIYGGLVRSSENLDVPIEYLRELSRMLINDSAEFVKYCGLDILGEFNQRVLDTLTEIDDRGDFTALMTHMSLYLNCLCGWTLQLFPWHVGDHLRQQRSREVA